jgi:hypothetical protein
MYSLRNKRSIAHKGAVDPNIYDLRFLFHAAQWVLAEMVRVCAGTTMTEAGTLIDKIQAPLSLTIEDVGSERLVLLDLTTREEILVLLHSFYPVEVSAATIATSLKRRKPDTVRKATRALWDSKLIGGATGGPYKLTQTGRREASGILAEATSG